VDFFYQTGPKDEIFTVRRGDDSAAIVQTGDGQTGSRLPTGPNLAQAKYRSGLGAAGNLERGRLTNLMSRPLGLQGVSQPLIATGGEDPESRENARTNAPLTVKTLDRLVSLADYADFARAYSGIAKAHSAWGRFGLTQGILLTIAGVDGQEVPYDSDLGEKFRGTLHRYRDPAAPVEIVNYAPLSFKVQAKLYYDHRYDEDGILAAATASLTERFNFAHRQLGQAVTSADIISLLQNLDGVRGVDLDALHLEGTPGARHTRLPARAGHIDRHGQVFPAELLTLADNGLNLTAIATAP
jgi:predicted phage baseplate assembly protein